MTDQAAKNRAAHPLLAKAMDDFRRVFGPGVKLIHGTDGGKELGRHPDYWPRNWPADAEERN